MTEDIKKTELILSLVRLEKDKGFVSLVDVIAAKKSYKEGKNYTNEVIINALKVLDVHYTESEDGSEFDEEEPTEEELEGKISLEEPLSLDDDSEDFDFDEEPTSEELNELEKDVDYSDSDDDEKKSDDDEDEDEEDEGEEEEFVEENMNGRVQMKTLRPAKDSSISLPSANILQSIVHPILPPISMIPARMTQYVFI
mgnify:CR=1 FL=1